LRDLSKGSAIGLSLILESGVMISTILATKPNKIDFGWPMIGIELGFVE
jgi:hypothetical protein